jgi:hypothetical protein
MSGDRRTAAWLGALCLLWSACFHHTRDWNSASRLLLTHALVEHGSLEVTPFVAVNGRLVRDPPTRDLASPDRERYFSDKAPGQSLLGAAALYPLRALGAADEHPTASESMERRPEELSLRRTDYWLTFATSGLTGAIGTVLVFVLLRRWNVGRSTAAATALAFHFASPWQVYATLYYSHVLAGTLTLSAIALLDLGSSRASSSVIRAFAAGFCAGAAVVAEYTMATFVVAVMVAGAATSIGRMGERGGARTRNAAALLAFLFGGLLPALLLGWYHFRVTGDPFVPAYRYEVERGFAAVHGRAGGIPLSTLQPGAMKELLVGLSIGLLWFAASAVWSIPGIWTLTRRRPFVGRAVLLSSLLLFAAIACFPNWNGGLATGPRFLVPILPLLFVAAGVATSSACAAPFGRSVVAFWAPVVIASGALNIAMNAAGARKPFDLSIGDFLRAVAESPQRETHAGDWVLSFAGIDAGFSTAFAVLLGVAVLGGVCVLRSAASQDV